MTASPGGPPFSVASGEVPRHQNALVESGMTNSTVEASTAISTENEPTFPVPTEVHSEIQQNLHVQSRKNPPCAQKTRFFLSKTGMFEPSDSEKISQNKAPFNSSSSRGLCFQTQPSIVLNRYVANRSFPLFKKRGVRQGISPPRRRMLYSHFRTRTFPPRSSQRQGISLAHNVRETNPLLVHKVDSATEASSAEGSVTSVDEKVETGKPICLQKRSWSSLFSLPRTEQSKSPLNDKESNTNSEEVPHVIVACSGEVLSGKCQLLSEKLSPHSPAQKNKETEETSGEKPEDVHPIVVHCSGETIERRCAQVQTHPPLLTMSPTTDSCFKNGRKANERGRGGKRKLAFKAIGRIGNTKPLAAKKRIRRVVPGPVPLDGSSHAIRRSSSGSTSRSDPEEVFESRSETKKNIASSMRETAFVDDSRQDIPLRNINAWRCPPSFLKRGNAQSSRPLKKGAVVEPYQFEAANIHVRNRERKFKQCLQQVQEYPVSQQAFGVAPITPPSPLSPLRGNVPVPHSQSVPFTASRHSIRQSQPRPKIPVDTVKLFSKQSINREKDIPSLLGESAMYVSRMKEAAGLNTIQPQGLAPGIPENRNVKKSLLSPRKGSEYVFVAGNVLSNTRSPLLLSREKTCYVQQPLYRIPELQTGIPQSAALETGGGRGDSLSNQCFPPIVHSSDHMFSKNFLDEEVLPHPPLPQTLASPTPSLRVSSRGEAAVAYSRMESRARKRGGSPVKNSNVLRRKRLLRRRARKAKHTLTRAERFAAPKDTKLNAVQAVEQWLQDNTETSPRHGEIGGPASPVQIMPDLLTQPPKKDIAIMATPRIIRKEHQRNMRRTQVFSPTGMAKKSKFKKGSKNIDLHVASSHVVFNKRSRAVDEHCAKNFGYVKSDVDFEIPDTSTQATINGKTMKRNELQKSNYRDTNFQSVKLRLPKEQVNSPNLVKWQYVKSDDTQSNIPPNVVKRSGNAGENLILRKGFKSVNQEPRHNKMHVISKKRGSDNTGVPVIVQSKSGNSVSRTKMTQGTSVIGKPTANDKHICTAVATALSRDQSNRTVQTPGQSAKHENLHLEAKAPKVQSQEIESHPVISCNFNADSNIILPRGRMAVPNGIRQASRRSYPYLSISQGKRVPHAAPNPKCREKRRVASQSSNQERMVDTTQTSAQAQEQTPTVPKIVSPHLNNESVMGSTSISLNRVNDTMRRDSSTGKRSVSSASSKKTEISTYTDISGSDIIKHNRIQGQGFKPMVLSPSDGNPFALPPTKDNTGPQLVVQYNQAQDGSQALKPQQIALSALNSGSGESSKQTTKQSTGDSIGKVPPQMVVSISWTGAQCNVLSVNENVAQAKQSPNASTSQKEFVDKIVTPPRKKITSVQPKSVTQVSRRQRKTSASTGVSPLPSKPSPLLRKEDRAKLRSQTAAPSLRQCSSVPAKSRKGTALAVPASGRLRPITKSAKVDGYVKDATSKASISALGTIRRPNTRRSKSLLRDNPNARQSVPPSRNYEPTSRQIVPPVRSQRSGEQPTTSYAIEKSTEVQTVDKEQAVDVSTQVSTNASRESSGRLPLSAKTASHLKDHVPAGSCDVAILADFQQREFAPLKVINATVQTTEDASAKIDSYLREVGYKTVHLVPESTQTSEAGLPKSSLKIYPDKIAGGHHKTSYSDGGSRIVEREKAPSLKRWPNLSHGDRWNADFVLRTQKCLADVASVMAYENKNKTTYGIVENKETETTSPELRVILPERKHHHHRHRSPSSSFNVTTNESSVSSSKDEKPVRPTAPNLVQLRLHQASLLLRKHNVVSESCAPGLSASTSQQKVECVPPAMSDIVSDRNQSAPLNNPDFASKSETSERPEPSLTQKVATHVAQPEQIEQEQIEQRAKSSAYLLVQPNFLPVSAGTFKSTKTPTVPLRAPKSLTCAAQNYLQEHLGSQPIAGCRTDNISIPLRRRGKSAPKATANANGSASVNSSKSQPHRVQLSNDSKSPPLKRKSTRTSVVPSRAPNAHTAPLPRACNSILPKMIHFLQKCNQSSKPTIVKRVKKTASNSPPRKRVPPAILATRSPLKGRAQAKKSSPEGTSSSGKSVTPRAAKKKRICASDHTSVLSEPLGKDGDLDSVSGPSDAQSSCVERCDNLELNASQKRQRALNIVMPKFNVSSSNSH